MRTPNPSRQPWTLRPTLDPIDEEMNQFERDIRQLKIEYEQFFGGGKKRPPDGHRMAHRLDDQAPRRPRRGHELRAALPLRQSVADLRKVSGHFPQAHAQAGRRQRPAPLRRRGPRNRGRNAPPRKEIHRAGRRRLPRPVARAEESRRDLHCVSRVPGQCGESTDGMSRAKVRAVPEAQGRRAPQRK